MALSEYNLTGEIELVDGYWFPQGIKKTAPAHAHKHADNAEAAARHCYGGVRRYAIQAGGNVGLWPRRLSPHFEHVFTFEPEPVSYRCLARNIAGLGNVAAYEAALGEGLRDRPVGIRRESLGSHYVVGGSEPASSVAAMTSIDQFCADGRRAFRDDMPIDLIQLDIEGFEIYALKGAYETLNRCHPVLCLEWRRFPGRYIEGLDELAEFLGEVGYVCVADLPGNDKIFKHKDSR